MKRPYKVIKHVTFEFEFDLDDCNSPEEAESRADQEVPRFFGGATVVDDVTVEVYPIDFGALGETQEDDEEENGND